jgi:uncharacterized delta-60 repeat protein
MFFNSLQQFVTRLRGSKRLATRRPVRSRGYAGVERLEDRTLLSAGTLDANFGNLGRTVTDLTTVSGVASDVANSVAIQSDGKYIVAGVSSTFITQGILSRYNTDGTLDPTFGAGGSIASSFFSGGFTGMAIESDGSIVASGQVNDVNGNSYFGVLKVTSAGLLDPTFGINGLAIADFANLGIGYTSEFPHALTLQGTTIVVAGEGVSSFGDKDMLVARFTASGNLDATFNTGGGLPGEEAVFFDLGGNFDDIAYDVTIDNSNRILLAGSAQHPDLDFAVARLNSNGGLDASFGGVGTGKKAIDFGFFLDEAAFAIAVEPGATGNIVVGGYTTNSSNFSEDFGITRLSGTTGAVLGGFGLVHTDFGTANEPSNDRIMDLKIQGTQVVVAGFSNSFTGVLPDQTFALARYSLSNGLLDPNLDTTSGNGGRVQTAFFADAQASANSLAIDSSGNYITVGSSGGIGAVTQNWALVRYSGNGTVDTAFGNQGRVLSDQSFWNGISNDHANSAITLSDGRIVVAGSSSLLTGGTYGVLACYLPNGQLDPSFGVGGEIASPYFSGGFQDLVVLPDGSIVATGQVQDIFANAYFGLLKVSANGLLDPTFGINGLTLADFASLGIGYTSEIPHALALQGTSFVIAGEGVSSFGDKDMLVARFTASGNLDATFNTGGNVPGEEAVLFDLGGNLNDVAYDVAIDNSNRILLAGSAEHPDLDFAVARLNSNGGLDASFGGAGTGKKAIDFGFFLNEEAFAIAVDPGASGNILVGGYTTNSSNFSEDFGITQLSGTTGAVLGGFGLVHTDFGTANEPSNDRIMDLKIQGTQVVVAGFANSFAGVLPNQTFALARYNLSNGVLDPNLDFSSGNGGRVQAAFFATTVSTANALTFDAAGNYILVGSSGDGAFADNFALAKFQKDGTISPTFGNQGLVLTDFSPVVGPNDTGTATAIASDGKIVVAALSQSPFGAGSGVIARYNADGSLDQTFGSGGLVGAAFFNLGFADLAVLPDGSIVATGQIQDFSGVTYFGILKLDSHGLVDPTFGINGLALANFSTLGIGYTSVIPHALTLQGSSIVVAGEGVSSFGDKDMLVARFTASGNLDATFNTGGNLPGEEFVAFDLGGNLNDIAFDVTIDNSNRILLAGSAQHPDLDFAVARLNSNGGLDASFGGVGTGKKAIDFGFFLDEAAFAIAVEPGATGNIVVGGYTTNNSNFSEDFGITRLSGTTGAVLGGFGLVHTDFGTANEPTNDRIMDLRIQGTQVVVAGFSTALTGVIASQQFALARYNISNGTLDSTVSPDTGDGGRVTTDFFASSKSSANSLAIDANNNWVVVGSAGDGVFADNIAVARYTDPPATTVAVTPSATTFSEAGGTVTVTATLNVKSLVPVIIPVTFSGTATFNTDYTSGTLNPGQIVVPAGSLTGSLTITGVPDLIVEGTETVILTLGAPSNATNSGSTQLTLNIADANNAAPTGINLSNSSVAENQPNAVVGTLTAVDNPSDTETFAIQAGGNGNLFTIVGNTLKVGATGLDFEALAGGIANVTIKVTDQGGLSFTKTIPITVQDVNEAPVLTANQVFTIPENLANATNVGSLVAATDPDKSAPNNTLTFSIVSGNPSNPFSISSSGQISVSNSAALNFEATQSFTLQVKVTDGGGLSDTKTVTINLTDVNEAPSVNANQSFSIPENSIATTAVGGLLATDPDGTAPFNSLTYSIVSGNPSNPFSINSSTGAITVANSAALNFETTPTFTLQVKVTDGGNLSDTKPVTITLTDVNEAPSVTAGQNLSIPENSVNNSPVGTLLATDPDTTAPNNSLTYSIVSGNPSNPFSINSVTGAISVSNAAALNFETTPTFTLQVKVTDGGGLSDTKPLTVTLTDVNEAPTITLNQVFSVAENSPFNASVGTVLATDPDSTAPNNTLTYSIVSGGPSNPFSINPGTGAITVSNSAALNFETTPVFVLQVKVTDGGNLSSTQNVTVNLTDVNEAPSIAAAQSFSIAENSAVGAQVGTVVATDPDTTAPNNTLNFSIVSGNPSNPFSINSAGVITVTNVAALDFETNPTFTLQVKVTDGGGLNVTQPVTVKLTDVNETPTITANQSFTIAENLAASSQVGTVVAFDPDLTAPNNTLSFSIVGGIPSNPFSINSAGVITVSNTAALDFETNPTFTLQVKVTDGGGLNVTQPVTVSLTDVNETPTITANQSFTIAENLAAGSQVGTVAASDPDHTAPNNTLSFSIVSGNPSNPFSINSAGVISVSNSAALNFEATQTFTLQVKVTDSGAGSLNSTQAVVINLTDVNETPSITSGQTFSINENSPNTTAIGTVIASDPDSSVTPNGTKTFSLVTNPQNAFAINAATGVITVAKSSVLDFETTPTFTVSVKVTDGGSPALSATQDVTINLNDVNEPPVIPANQTFSIPENSLANTAVGTLSASDPEHNTLTYSIASGSPSNPFSINSSGQITVSSPTPILDFETTPSFTLQVKVTDTGNNITTQSFTVNLTNVNEKPVLGGGSGTSTFIKKHSPAVLMPNVTVNDPDSPTDLAKVVVSFFVPKAGLEANYNVGNASSLGSVVSSGPTSFKKAGGTRTLTITLNDGVTSADVQAFLRGITFSSTKFDTASKSLGRQIAVTVTDHQGANSNLLSTTVRALAK